MARVTVEDCLKRVNNRFALVQLATRRTRQLYKGETPIVDAPKNKLPIVALREFASGKIDVISSHPEDYSDINVRLTPSPK